MFKKTIEIYDGNFTSHYICPVGAAIVAISIILGFGLPLFDFIGCGLKNPGLLSLPLFFVGSFIGND
jgi:hypothetical protein